jgi:hypothetical protein
MSHISSICLNLLRIQRLNCAAAGLTFALVFLFITLVSGFVFLLLLISTIIVPLLLRI